MIKLLFFLIFVAVIFAVGLSLCFIAQYGIPLDYNSPKAWGNFGLIHIKLLIHELLNASKTNAKIIAGLAIGGSILLIISGCLFILFLLRLIFFFLKH